MEPVFKSGVRVVWHCDGNLMQMVPRLIDVGIKGFQGFQYEDGMDYVKICKMKAKDGTPLIIEGGVSVTRTLPFGTPEDVRREMQFLVENGPETGLFLSTSSSVTPGVPWENIEMMIEGFRYYRQHGRD
jgi:uroporphyrinogen decarboxylase